MESIKKFGYFLRRWGSTILLGISILGFIVMGPLKHETPNSDVDYGKYYEAFSLKHLRSDLSEYTNLIATSLDYYKNISSSQPSEIAGSNVKSQGTSLVPNLNTATTLETNRAGTKDTNKVITTKYMTPQGVTVTPKYIITSAYDHSHKGASILNVTDRLTGKHIKNIVLKGRPHVGGISYEADRNLLWVCGSSERKAALIAIKMNNIDRYNFNKSHKAISYYHVGVLMSLKKASAVAYHDGQLWVGFFGVTGDSSIQRFDVKEILHNNKEAVKKYKGDNFITHVRNKFSQKTIGKIQGFSFYKNLMYISQSYGPEDSKLYIYKVDKTKRHFTKDEALAVVTMPAHMEQITIDNNRMYAVFESGARAYEAHENTRIGRVVSFNVDKLPPFTK